MVVALLAATAGIGGVALARGAEALPWRSAPAATGNDPFMGIADPSAPYDLRYLDDMIMHHEGAIMSTRGLIANSSQPEMRDLARRIIAGQQYQVDASPQQRGSCRHSMIWLRLFLSASTHCWPLAIT